MPVPAASPHVLEPPAEMVSQLETVVLDTAMGALLLLLVPSPTGPYALSPARTRSRRAAASAAVACAVTTPAAEEGSWPDEVATHPSSRPCRPGRCQKQVHTCGHCRPRS